MVVGQKCLDWLKSQFQGPPGYFESRGVVLRLRTAYNMWNRHKQGIGFL
jgi:hypothetical protein